MKASLRIVRPTSTPKKSDRFELGAWLRFKALFRALGFASCEDCAEYLGEQSRQVRRWFKGTARVPGRALWGLDELAKERGVTVAEQPKVRAA